MSGSTYPGQGYPGLYGIHATLPAQLAGPAGYYVDDIVSGISSLIPRQTERPIVVPTSTLPRAADRPVRPTSNVPHAADLPVVPATHRRGPR